MRRLITVCMMVVVGILATNSLAQHLASKTVERQLLNQPSRQFVTLGEALSKLEQAYGVNIVYDDAVVNGRTAPQLVSSSQKFQEALETALGNYPIYYKKVGARTVVLQHMEPPPVHPEPAGLIAQGHRVSGRIIDGEDRTPLPGLNIVVKNTDRGTTTNNDGLYVLENVSPEDTLIFSYIGYQREEVPIAGRQVIDIFMIRQVIPGEEVTVVGYGTQQRREITGSVARISAVTFQDIPVLSFEQAIQGQLSGVDIQENTGEPGGEPNVRIRGTGSISAGNDPLYVIDGLPISKNLSLQGTLFRRRAAFKPPPTNPLASLNPQDIESIEILKDASAAAIYGSRGSNGVILITTKKGKAGSKPAIRFDSYTGVQSLANKPDMMNAKELIEYTKDARNNNYLDKYDPLNPNSPNYNPNYNPDNNNGRPNDGNVRLPDKYINWDGTDTDWLDLIFSSAPITNTNVSVSGGSQNISYYLSGGFLQQDGIIENSQFKRYSFSVRFVGDLTESIQFGANINTAFTNNSRVPANAPYFGRPPGIVYSAMVHSPVLKPFNVDGTPNQLDAQSYLGGGTTSASNPLAIMEAIDENLDNHRTFGNVYTDIMLTKGLSFRSSFGIDLNNYQNSFFRGNSLLYRTAQSGDPYAQNSAATGTNWVWENTLHYDKTFKDIHNFTALLGYSAQKEVSEQNSVIAVNFPDDQVQTISGGLVTDGSSIKEEWSLVSMLARINYNFNYKYLLTATIRSDRSSRFGAGNQTGIFPSLSVAWRMTEEKFMQRLGFLSELKLRASYGETGNFLIPNYGSIGLLGQGLYVEDDQPVSAVFPATISNEDLGWETTKQVDLGIDFALFEDRIYGTFDWYNSKTEDLLLQVGVQSASGFTNALTNIGKVRNKGVELSLTSRNLVGDFQWTTDFNFAANDNEVLSLGPGDEPILVAGAAGIRHITQVGSPMGSYYGWVVDGIYQSEADIANSPVDEMAPAPKPGDFKFKDVNGDGVINTDDRTITGSYHPDFIYGFTNRFYYKNFDLSIFFQGVEGREILNLTARHMKNGEANFNSYAIENERWRSPEQPGNGKIPRADRQSALQGNNNRPSSFQVEDGSYLRLRNLTIGYRLPHTWSSKFAESVRIYISGRNLFTITDYIGFNPEVSLQSQNMLVQGEDYGAYPLARTWIIGTNVSF
ncbi:MAG: SusC/RagA family TonB-linked outer membrane protein [bacterium]